MIRVGQKVCRADDPRHSATVLSIDRGCALLRWHRAGATEAVFLDEIEDAAALRRRHDREVDAIITAFNKRRGK